MHEHQWREVREVTKGKFVYKFFVCDAPNCPNPDKMEIKEK